VKALYDKDGVSPQLEVEILGWDRDKYFAFKDSSGEIQHDKCWKFSVKRSNNLHTLAYADWGSIVVVTRKEAAKEIKKRYKKSVVYRVKTTSLDYYKEFNSLRKALNFCKSNKDATFLHACFYYKNGSCSGPVLEKLEGNWYYFAQISKQVSEKTISEFCFND